MPNAGASVEAFLKLDATDFKGELDNVSSTVTKFKESMLDVGKESSTFTTGLNNVSKAITNLIRDMNILDQVDTKTINKFKNMASGLNMIAEAAQRMSVDVQRGSVGMEALATVMEIFEAGASSAEVTLNLTNAQLRELAKNSTTAKAEVTNLKAEFKSLEQTLLTMGEGVQPMARTQEQTKLMRAEFKKAQSDLMNFANSGVNEFHKIDTSVNELRNALRLVEEALAREREKMISMSNATSQGRQNLGLYHQNLRQLAMGVDQFNAIQTKATSSTGTFADRLKMVSQQANQLANGMRIIRPPTEASRMSMDELTSSLARNSEAMRLNGAETLRNMGYKGRLSAEEAQVRANSYSATTATQQYTNALSKSTTATQRQASATRGLGRALSSLRMIGTMVASMMVWNFASSLVNATRETVNAKSEMEGYFKMLNFSQKDVDHFNNALDDTVKQFQRVNKYSLGETISSIGVEFDLSTREMEKAMKVTSMITSEYLRAGRNANEASLAVKDVLQGQFQRLSRETGVKGEQLKEAGWSGDTTDVLGLMEALEKVGLSRNWDVFAEKANSLNDIVTILQNRFGEWSAEMVNVVQPSIVSAFNTIMSVGTQLGGVLSGIWEWLNGDGLVNQAVKWGGLATAIGTVSTALIVYRTGANLVQLAQMGLRGSIMATVFSLKAEEVAEYGSLKALTAKVTGIKAEQVATLGVRKALLTKVLGLHSELVAQKGIKGAIMASTFARQLEEASQEGANAEEMKAIVLKQREQLANMGTLKSIFARIAGVNMETFAEQGLIVALAERVASSPLYIGSLKAEEVAEMSTARAALFLSATLLPIIGILAGLAIGLYSVIKPLQDASEGMKKFGNLVENGDDIIKGYKSDVDNLTKSKTSLQSKLDSLEKGTKKYKRTQDKLRTTTKDLETAEENYENSIKAVEMARSRQQKFEERASEIAIHKQTQLKDAYIGVGISASEASELASSELREAEEGAEQLRLALQRLKFEADKGAKKNKKVLKMLDQYGLSDETLKKYGSNLANAQDKVAEGFEKFMTSDDLMERVGGWFEIQQGRLEEWWTELNAFFEVRDWDSIGQKLQEGLKYIFSGFGAFDWMTPLGEALDKKGVFGALMDFLWGEGDTDGILDIAWDALNSWVIEPANSWLKWFFEDPVSHFNQVNNDLAHSFAKFIFGKDEDSTIGDMIEDWFKDNILDPFFEFIKPENLTSWLMNQMAVKGVDFLSMYAKAFFGEDSLQGMNSQEIVDLITGSFSNLFANVDLSAITNSLSQMFWGSLNAFFQSLGSGGGEESGGATGMKKIDTSWIMSFVYNNIVLPFGNALNTGIQSIPIVSDILQLLGLIPSANPDAQSKGSQLARAFGNALQTVVGNIPIVGDILRLLGLIPSTEPQARSSGSGVGKSIFDGLKSGMGNIVNWAVQEFQDIANGIKGKMQDAYDSAKDFGKSLWNGLNSILQRASPGFFHDQVMLEFGTDIPNAIQSSGATAYSVAQEYGQQIHDGISSVNTSISMDGMVGEYQDDAQIVATTSQMMGTDTTTAFNQMNTAVNQTTTQMQGNVTTSYSTMQQKQASMLNNMKSSNLTAYNDMYQKSNQSLLQMRDSTSNVTHQMTNAWSHMKDQIVASADKLKSDSTSHFTQLSSTIGSFYRKIQNPSNWGAGTYSYNQNKRPSVGRRAVRTITGKHGAGIDPYSSSSNKKMSIRDLMKMVDVNEDVPVDKFLAMFSGGFGWNNWSPTHYNYIKNRSDEWGMKSPMIMNRIPAGSGWKVGQFENGQPKISWATFMSTAEALFSAIPYKFYYDSQWKGSWVEALKAGATNCSDGADALIALAQTMGFSGTKAHTTLGNGVGHFYAIINGKKMDTTHFQNAGSWSPLGGAGIPTRTYGRNMSGAGVPQGKTVNITVDMNNATIYGVDDLDSKIQESVQKGIQSEFNDPYTIAI